MILLTITRNVGRLVEARFSGNPTEVDVARWRKEADACLRACIAQTGKPAVCCTDMRASGLFRPAVADDLTAMMRSDNAAVYRNALLGTGGAIFTMQLQRLLREAGSEQRRIFTESGILVAWLDEVLTPAERVRLREFIVAGDREVSSSDAGGFGSERPPSIPPPSIPPGRPGSSPRAAGGLRPIKGGRS